MGNFSFGKLGDRQRAAIVVAFAVILAAAAVAFAAFVIVRIADSGEPQEAGTKVPETDSKGEEVELPEWIDVDLLPVNEYSRPGTPTDEIVGIVIHYVGNPGTSAKANRNYFAGLADSGATYASSNFIVGLDGEVIECVPLGEVAYCSNNRNHDTVSIECCHPDESGQFTHETYDSLIKLCRYLVDLYGIEPEGVIRHYDVTGKMCPVYYVEHEDAWRSLVDDIFAEE